MSLAVGIALGAVCTYVGGRALSNTREGESCSWVDDSRRVAIVLVGASERLVERQVDRRTGSLGFSHVIVDAAEHNARGQRLVYDVLPLLGVHRVPLSHRYGSRRNLLPRPLVRISLPVEVGTELRGAMRSQVGLPYDLPATVDPKRPGLVCSRLVHRGLPMSLRSRIKPHSKRHPVSPNCIARAFGVEGPFSPDVEL